MGLTVEDFKKIDLAYLKKNGYLLDVPTNTELVWRNPSSQVWGHTDIYFRPNHAAPIRGAMALTGKIGNKPFHIVVAMRLQPSNLGRGGGQWYFLCPKTARRCRTLFFNGDTFVCRQALGKVKYRCQADSQESRLLNLVSIIEYNQMLDNWYLKSHTRKYYNGKPTRMMARFLKLQKVAQQATRTIRSM